MKTVHIEWWRLFWGQRNYDPVFEKFHLIISAYFIHFSAIFTQNLLHKYTQFMYSLLLTVDGLQPGRYISLYHCSSLRKITNMVLKIRAVENLCRISCWGVEENVNSYLAHIHSAMLLSALSLKMIFLTGYGSIILRQTSFQLEKWLQEVPYMLSTSLSLQSLSPLTIRFSSFCPMLILNTCINSMMYFPWLQSNGNTRAGRKMGNILLQTKEKCITMTDSYVFLACFTVERRNCLKLNICGRRGELWSAITFIALCAEAGMCSLDVRYVLEASRSKSNSTHTVLGSKVVMLM